MNFPRRLAILLLLFLTTLIAQCSSQDMQIPDEEVLTLWKKGRPRGPPRFGKRSSFSREVVQLYRFPYLNNVVLLEDWQQPAYVPADRHVFKAPSKSDERKFLELLTAVRNDRRHQGDHLNHLLHKNFFKKDTFE